MSVHQWNRLLTALQTDDFGVVCYGVASPEAQRNVLDRQPLVRAIREAYRRGSLTEKEIREFADWLLEGLERGCRVPYEEAFSAIAVALEPIHDAFTDEYINDLAALQIAEMPYATRIARICQKQRNQPK